MNRLLLFAEIVFLYTLTITLLHLFLNKEAFSMNLQPNIYLVVYIAFTLYAGILAMTLGIIEYFTAYFLLYKTYPKSEDVYTLIAFGSLSLLFYLLNQKNITLLEESNQYLREKLEEVIRNFYLLKVAYEQIFRRYMINMSLRDILEELKKTYVEVIKGNKSKEVLYKMLEGILFNEFEVRSFALYVKNQGSYKKVFSSENYRELPSDVWQDVLEKLKLNPNSIIKAADIELETAGFLACIPVVDIKNNVRMFLIIQQMEFKAYNLENLQLIGIVLSYLYHYVYNQFNSTLSEFAFEFKRNLELCVTLKRKYNINSTIVIIKCVDLPYDLCEELFAYIQRHTRTLDTIFATKDKMFVLLNLTNVIQAQSYIDKIKTLVKSRWTIDVERNLDFKIVPIVTDIEKLKSLIIGHER